ncbi:MAG: GIY-YIG nuclease family protein [Candidatus Parcubacteria bacterium]|nr:GIY-YIG nuclease family protein [Candidatus Parcubacteria bacterium]
MLTKEAIIEEIRKYAKENCGKTPSEKIFYEHVGIGIYDLKKNGWANYGELVSEAGLTPNTFDNTQYSREQLCEMFIEVIREKGKWPTRGILDVKHHNEVSFPDSSTFYKKLGLKIDLAKAILAFIKDKQEYNDIIEVCNLTMGEVEDQDEFLEDGDVTSGFVYLGKQHGDYKIGKAKDANRRRDDITLLGSEPFNLIHEIKTDDMDGLEKYWHNRFKSKWKRGEWFNLNSVDVKAFKRWRKIY